MQSLSVFNIFPYRFRVSLFGWYGQLDSRENRGELSSIAPIEPIRYIDYDELLFREVASSSQLEFLQFGVTLDKRLTTTAPQAPTIPPVTTQPTTAPQALPVSLLLGVGVAVVVAALVVILIVTFVCVFGRRRNQPKKK